MTPSCRVLPEDVWHARAAAHQERMRRYVTPHRERSSAGQAHPVLDFMFSYYSYRPARLLRWHPGPGVVLTGPSAQDYLRYPGYRRTDGGVLFDPGKWPTERHRTARFVVDLLRATAERPPAFNCFGMHEWAMVYRQPEDRRHARWPLRLGAGGTDAVVESATIRCTHYDAFRFFTPPARDRNALHPTRDQQVAVEQRGCLHVTMDLYKWAYKLEPATPSELIADCFELAVQVRELDMRASPYDLRELGYEPVAVETPRGRADYAAAQAEFSARATALRSQLIGLCDELLAAPESAREPVTESAGGAARGPDEQRRRVG